MKIYTLFAGVNGAGKSTFFRALNYDFGVRVNLDEIIMEHYDRDWKNPKVQMAAGRKAVSLIKDCINSGTSFNQETTLTGQSIFSTIGKAKAAGFKVHLYYVGLESVELSMKRVAARVAAGGHGVPEEDLRRRYANSFENLKRVLPMCDSVQIYDNSGDTVFDALNPLLVIKDGIIVFKSEHCPSYLRNVLNEYVLGGYCRC